MDEFLHFRVVTKIRENTPGLVDGKTRCNLVGQDRLAIGRQSGQLAFMPQRCEPEGPSHCHISIGDAVDRQRREQTFLTAINGLESAVGEMAMAEFTVSPPASAVTKSASSQ